MEEIDSEFISCFNHKNKNEDLKKTIVLIHYRGHQDESIFYVFKSSTKHILHLQYSGDLRR